MPKQNLNYLVVDDSSTIRAMARGHLYEMGCKRVDLANDGCDALDKLKDRSYDMVITGINMPKMDGFQLLDSMKANPALKHVPVLMMGCEARKEQLIHATQSGAAGYILKPCTRADLEARMDKILAKHSPAAAVVPPHQAFPKIETLFDTISLTPLDNSPTRVTLAPSAFAPSSEPVICRTGHYMASNGEYRVAAMPEDKGPMAMANLAFALARTYPEALDVATTAFDRRDAITFSLPGNPRQMPAAFAHRVHEPRDLRKANPRYNPDMVV